MITKNLSIFYTASVVFIAPLIVQYFYVDFIRESEFNARIFWSLLFLGLCYSRFKLIELFLKLLLLVFMLGGVLDILYAITFNSVFVEDSLSAIGLTDQNEILEFLSSYYSFTNIFISVLYFIISTYLIITSKITKPFKNKHFWFLLISLTIFIALIFSINKWKRFFDTVPGVIGKVLDYSQSNFQATVASRINFYNSSIYKVSKKLDDTQTHVVIIGESMSKNHLAIYGYPRSTTPFLTSLKEKNKILIFNDVITPFTQTAPALIEMLTEINYDNKINFENAVSIVGLLKKSGYKIYWLSNQQSRRFPTSHLAALADESIFMGLKMMGMENHRYDEYLLPFIKQTLLEKNKYKVIFVHLMGSHLQYKNRYPNEFEEYTEYQQILGKQHSKSELQYINSYDNSILYTDYILKQIHQYLVQFDDNRIKTWLYFADHGEEVYDDIDFKGHRPHDITRNMVEIPLLLWVNQNYQKANSLVYENIKSNKSHPWVASDLFHMISCIHGLETKLVNYKFGLCDKNPPKYLRSIYGINYDTQLNKIQMNSYLSE